MKLRFIYTLFAVGLIYLVLQSASAGRAAAGGLDRTGSPISGGTCAQCHSGGSFGTTSINVQILDGGTPITSYTPGQTYSIEATVTASSGNPSGYAFQTAALLSNNTQAGSFSSVTSSNTRLTTVASSGVQYFEHQGLQAAGVFSASWTAPAAGSGTISIYSVGLACNGNGGTSGDVSSSSATLTLSEAVATTISYAQTSFCGDDTSNYAPIITGNTGGSYSITTSTGNANAAFNTTDGSITPSNAVASGDFTVAYIDGTDTATTDITITVESAGIDYSPTSLCASSTTLELPSLTAGSTTGGTFSASPAGLSINASSGEIDPSASNAGNYTITYTTPGTNGCTAVTATDNISIVVDDATFAYSSTSFCQSVANPTPTITGLAGGTFSSTGSPTWLNTSTGEIDMANIPTGTFDITYVTTNNCNDSSTVSITIVADEDASFNYTGTTFCPDDSLVTPSITGTTGGTFTISAGATIDPLTGQIDATNTTAGTYDVTYNTGGTCPDSDTVTLTIVASDDATFSLSPSAANDSIYVDCNDNSITATITGTTGGTFTATPAGLTIDGLTGAIDLTSSTLGTYTVIYQTSGICPTLDSTTIVYSTCANVPQLETAATYSIYPNPNTGQFTLEYKGSQGLSNIRVMDIMGKVVYNQQVLLNNDDQRIINLIEVPAGTYFLQITNENTIHTEKLNIIR